MIQKANLTFELSIRKVYINQHSYCYQTIFEVEKCIDCFISLMYDFLFYRFDLSFCSSWQQGHCNLVCVGGWGGGGCGCVCVCVTLPLSIGLWISSDSVVFFYFMIRFNYLINHNCLYSCTFVHLTLS
jgi:hypothetical protein